MKKTETVFIAISGVKNSGKTTLITRLLPILAGYGLKIATIKHDGHEFEGDVPGTDTYRHRKAGAYGTAVFSKNCFMAVKNQEDVTEKDLCRFFPEADLILLEGFKGSDYPKIETVQKSVSRETVCDRKGLLAFVADFNIPDRGEIPCLSLAEPKTAARLIYNYWYCRTQMSMIILAGGKSRRMGRDKADMFLSGKTFLQHQIAKGETLGIQNIVVSGYGGSLCDRPVVFDRHLGMGPLGGLEAALKKVEHRACLVLSVDTPLISVWELQRMIEHSRMSEKRITVLKHGERIEPLVGIFKKDLADEIEKNLKDGKVKAFLDHVGFDVYESHGDEGIFLNINDQADYETAEKFLRDTRTYRS